MRVSSFRVSSFVDDMISNLFCDLNLENSRVRI